MSPTLTDLDTVTKHISLTVTSAANDIKQVLCRIIVNIFVNMTQNVQALVNECPERSSSATPLSYLVTCWEEKMYLQKIQMESWEVFFLSHVNILFSASKSVKYFHNLINSL